MNFRKITNPRSIPTILLKYKNENINTSKNKKKCKNSRFWLFEHMRQLQIAG